jgi:U3 small nucleolar RNA-associated protein 12
MVKSYNKYELSETFGLVTSGVSNIISVSDSSKSAGPGVAIVGANEAVLSWDVKKSELLGIWKDSSCNSQVTALSRSETDPDIFAVG